MGIAATRAKIVIFMLASSHEVYPAVQGHRATSEERCAFALYYLGEPERIADMKIFSFFLYSFMSVAFAGLLIGLMRLGHLIGVNETESGVAILVVSGFWLLYVKQEGDAANTKSITDAVYSRKSLD